MSDNQGRCQASGQVKIQDDLGSGHYLPGTVLTKHYYTPQEYDTFERFWYTGKHKLCNILLTDLSKLCALISKIKTAP